MRARAAGDGGDFGKYGLLRAITRPGITKKGGQETLSLGVVWYRHPDEKATNDGEHIDYLGPSGREDLLYDCLSKIVGYDSKTQEGKGSQGGIEGRE